MNMLAANARDLPEAEEVSDFFLSGLVADALDVDGVASGRHGCCVFGRMMCVGM
jgi:hypothetical protein